MDGGVLANPGDKFDTFRWRKRVTVARGTGPAEVILIGGMVVNVFSGELERADVSIVDGRIAAVGAPRNATQVIDCRGKFIAPSFIDAHMHMESSLLWVSEYVRTVLPFGTGAIVTDPHEYANVSGMPGLEAYRDATQGMPMRILWTAPSCVPASVLESAGAELNDRAIAEIMSWPGTVGLGEMMDYPGVLATNSQVGWKLATAYGKRRDGHAPGLSGNALQAYAASLIGSDHESTTPEEAMAKISAGMMVMIREGSAARNLEALLPIVNDRTYPRICFCTDDADVLTLQRDGHMDGVLRKAIRLGLDPVRAIRMATWNAAEYWRLDGIGAVAPGYEANLAILDNLEEVRVAATLFRGQVVAKEGEVVAEIPAPVEPDPLLHTIHMAPLSLGQLRLDPEGVTEAIEVIPDQIVTAVATVEPKVADGMVVSDPGQDLLKIVCVERHRETGRVGVGLVKGFGLTRGAMASSIAHDAHNIVAVGVSDADIMRAIVAVAEDEGGLAVVADGQVLASLPLPVAGLVSDQPAGVVAEQLDAVQQAAWGLGCTMHAPFVTLSFMALSVIPAARITDRGYTRT